MTTYTHILDLAKEAEPDHRVSSWRGVAGHRGRPGCEVILLLCMQPTAPSN